MRGTMAKKPEDRPDIEQFRRELRVISVYKKARKESDGENEEES